MGGSDLTIPGLPHVEIAIAEAIALMPVRTCYEDKGTPVLAYLKKMGWHIVEEKSVKDERDKWLAEHTTQSDNQP